MNHSRMGIGIIAGVGVALHLLFLLVVKPVDSAPVNGLPVPPVTRFMVGGELTSANETDARVVWSPVLFSLPSASGFSAELLDHDVKTSKTTVPPKSETEQFLSVDLQQWKNLDFGAPESLMISPSKKRLEIPEDDRGALSGIAPGRRVVLDPALRDRMIGEIVLPEGLGQSTDADKVIEAVLNVSEFGVVEHVFVQQPLSSKTLNQQLVSMLYQLRFKPGNALESRIEIYASDQEEAGGAP
ncbi:MAG: hypothetical protein JXR25_17230 [Pontiellaceae bacterium]|nr:hypothetical protein [Pontiellaceae bacterium]